MSIDPANPFAAPRPLPADGVGYADSYGPPPARPAGSPLAVEVYGRTGFPPPLRSVAGLGRAACGLLGLQVVAGAAGAAVAA